MDIQKTSKDNQETSAKTESSEQKETAMQLPTYPLTEDTPGIYFEKVTSGRP